MKVMKTILMGWLLIYSAGAIGADAVPEADAGIQERIERTVAAIVAQDPAVQERFEELRAAADRRSLLLQIARYLARSGSTEESMGGAVILHRLEFTADEKLEAILPHLEEAEPGIRHVFMDLLGTIDRPDGGEADFSVYESRLRADRRPPTRALILYMYEVSPAAALESMSRVFGDRTAPRGRATDLQDLLDRYEASTSWEEDDRRQALGILDELSRDPAWWVRLYAAETIGRHAELATPETARRLRNDPDALVRAVYGR